MTTLRIVCFLIFVFCVFFFNHVVAVELLEWIIGDLRFFQLFYFIPSLTAFLVFVFNCFSFLFHPFILSFFIDRVM